MIKVETSTYEIICCGGCPYCRDYQGKRGNRCVKGRRYKLVPDIWGEIPEWCLLETKKEDKDVRNKG